MTTKNSLANLKRWKNPEYKKKLSKTKIGDKNPMKNPKTAKKVSETRKRKIKNGEFQVWNKGKKGLQIAWNKGKKCPEISERQKGEKSHFWKDGISFKPYTPLFNKELKKIIKERDKNRCLICKKQQRLMIHHIDYNKKNCSPENLITLCNSCHSKTNTNRKQWETFFSCGKKKQYFLSIAQLSDRLSIVTLKSIKIHENKKEYEKEAQEIMNDLDVIAKEKNIGIEDFGQFVRASQINALCNSLIWENESFVRKGEKNLSKEIIADKLQFTHALNRIRNQSMNVISNIIGERKDLKLDYMDAELTKSQGYDFKGIL